MDNEIKFELVSRAVQIYYRQEGNYHFSLPTRSTKKSAGYDFYNFEDVEILPEQIVYVKTGVKAKFPDNVGLLLLNRSSNPLKKGLVLANGVGLVDADYYNNPSNEGEICFAFMNTTTDIVTIKAGEKLGQGVFVEYLTICNEGNIENERSGGFGSTGN